MKGYLAYPSHTETPRPGILVVHEWWGHNEYARTRADMLAKEGFVALALDMYGQGKQAEHPKDAMKFSSAVFKDLDGAKKKFLAAMETLKSHPSVDKEKIGAIGYCFGGGIVLTMARMGVDLGAVASFHGSLTSPVKAKKGRFDGEVYVFNGAADPMVKKEHIENFKKEFDRAGIEYQIKNYDGAMHAFTNPAATQLGKEYNLPLAYDPAADKDSWDSLLSFLANWSL
jgi:dienelactone hydrolase